jgi:hypothetical protein
MRRELARLGPQCLTPRTLIRTCRAIASMTAVASQLAADCRWRTMQLRGDRSERNPGGHAARNLLPLSQAQGAP